MTAASPSATPGAVGDDGLVEYRRTTQARRLGRRLPTLFGGLFLVVALAAMVLLPAHRHLSLEALVVSIACYVLAARVRFEYGTVLAIPTEPIFVAMWFLLPPRLIPLVVFAALVIGWLPDLISKRVAVDRIWMLAASSWFSLGPAVVIFLFAPHDPSWGAVPVYLGALAAQLACDFASTFVNTRAATIQISLRSFARATAPSFAVDSLLAPLGLLDGFATYHHPWALLLVLPVLLMFSTFAKERQHRIDNALELSTAYRGTAMLLGDVIEADHEYTGSHSRDVVELVLAVADELKLDPTERRRAEFAALLHDVGKVKIPTAIIDKAGPLDDDEWEIMKTHTVLGETMLDQIGGLLGEVGHIVRSCHERWDGTGYPDGLAGEDIPLTARIVCACDAWSAMTTDRSYRKSLTLEEATAELHRCAGTHFDPRVVDALAKVTLD